MWASAAESEVEASTSASTTRRKCVTSSGPLVDEQQDEVDIGVVGR